MKNKIWKFILSMIFTGVSFLCFCIPTKSITSIVYKHCNERTVTIEDDGTKLFFNYIGLFLLIMAIWIWRKELKINQFGFIGGNDIEPTDPETFPKEPKPDISNTAKKIDADNELDKTIEFETFKAKELKDNIISYFKERPYGLTNATILAANFGVSRQTIQRFLFELMKENYVRRDTYPGSGKANFSYSASIENRAIDDFVKHLKTEILSDNRFVRVSQRYETDAIVQTSSMNYVIEVKRMDTLLTKRIDEAIKQLLAIEEHIKLSPLNLVLIIATNKEQNKQLLDEYQGIGNLTIYLFDYDN
jgi:hypothetical protein